MKTKQDVIEFLAKQVGDHDYANDIFIIIKNVIRINLLEDKRNEYAGRAMQGFMSDAENLKRIDKYDKFGDMKMHSRVAIVARDYADALVHELKISDEDYI